MITPKVQTGAESIVYSAGTVTQSSSFTKPGFKNQTAPQQTITSTEYAIIKFSNSHLVKFFLNTYSSRQIKILGER